MIDFSGQTVLMIGGLSDLAAGVAAVFKEAGADLLVAYGSAGDQEVLSMYPASSLLKTSLEDPVAIASSLAEHTFNTAIICPGWFQHRPFMDASMIDVENAYTYNFEQTTYAAQAAAKRLIALGNGGSLIFLSSVVSNTPMIETNLVGSSLASLEVIARMAAVDLAPYGIRVNVVSGGWAEGSWSAPIVDKEGQMKEPSDIPAGRLGSVHDVGNACCFLASSIADYITGAVLPVDGGFSLTKSAVQSPY